MPGSSPPSSGAPMGSLPPPAGVTPVFDNPPRSSIPFTSTTACLVLASFFVVMRLYTRIFIIRSVGWDDALCVFAYILFIGYCVTFYELMRYGLGIDLWNIPYGTFDIVMWARWNYVQDLIYTLGLCCIKCSILLLYFRLFNVKPIARWLIYTSIAFVALYSVTGMLVTIFACRPLNTFWDALPDGKCLNSGQVGLYIGVLQIFSDLLIFSIPVPIILRLQYPLKQKLAVLSVFLAGAFGTVVSCIRLAYLANSIKNIAAFEDATTSTIIVLMWTTIEYTVAIIISCMTAAKPLLARLIPWLRELTSRRSGYSLGSRFNGTDSSPRHHEQSTARRLPSNSSDNAIMLDSDTPGSDMAQRELKEETSYPNLNYQPRETV